MGASDGGVTEREQKLKCLSPDPYYMKKHYEQIIFQFCLVVVDWKGREFLLYTILSLGGVLDSDG